MAELRRKYFARALDRRRSSQYNQGKQVAASPEKKGKRAFFNTIDTHQTPVVGPDSPVPVWMSVLHGPGIPNSQTP